MVDNGPLEGVERWQPVPVPRGDGRHDIGDDVRAAIVQRLTEDWSRDPGLTPEKARQLAMWAGAAVRSLLHELGTLRDLANEDAMMPEAEAMMLDERCEGRYPVPQTSPPRDEPFEVTYRCARPKGHDGPHGN